MKREVAAAYGIPASDWSLYVFDHLIPRELAGADLASNLWPEPRAEAKTKDKLERRLNRLTCAGKMTLKQAQKAIATDWRAEYARVFP